MGLFTVNPRKIPIDPNISSPPLFGDEDSSTLAYSIKNDRLNMEIRQKVA